MSRFNPSDCEALHFEAPDPARYPALALARRAWEMGSTGGAVLNAADEVAVESFLAGNLPFTGITDLVVSLLDEHEVVSEADIDDIEAADRWARRRAREKLDA